MTLKRDAPENGGMKRKIAAKEIGGRQIGGRGAPGD